MTGVTFSNWIAHPGDYVFVEVIQQTGLLRVVRRSANDLEAAEIAREYAAQGRHVTVFQLKGQLP